MPREEYTGRCQLFYFKSQKHLEGWKEEAKAHNLSLNRYLLEMAERGRVKESTRPKTGSPGDTQLRESLSKLLSENRDLNLICEKQQAEIIKLRHREFLQVQTEIMRRYSKELVELLRTGGVWPGQDILKALNIPQSDSEAVQIVYAQLKGLEVYGLVHEAIGGWKWVS